MTVREDAAWMRGRRRSSAATSARTSRRVRLLHRLSLRMRMLPRACFGRGARGGFVDERADRCVRGRLVRLRRSEVSRDGRVRRMWEFGCRGRRDEVAREEGGRESGRCDRRRGKRRIVCQDGVGRLQGRAAQQWGELSATRNNEADKRVERTARRTKVHSRDASSSRLLPPSLPASSTRSSSAASSTPRVAQTAVAAP